MVHFVEDGGEHAPGDTAGRVAPVIPLFATASAPRDRTPAAVSTVWGSGGVDDSGGASAEDGGTDGELEMVEKTLLRKLRTRQLSVSEARAVARGRDVADDAVDTLITAFVRRGYLDDERLADQLVHAGATRKGQGRRAIAMTLTQRGVPREVSDAALASLPDDDAERALEYARAKAPSMSRLDRDVALRRLVGQLSRRGFRSATAMAAAREALQYDAV